MRRVLLMTMWMAGCGGEISIPNSDLGPPPDGTFNATGALEIAAKKYPDLRTLWGRSITRTCGPNSGVCHDNRQFPDMQTASGLLLAIGKRCNQIRDDPSTIDNLCEPPGDVIQFGSFTTHVGKVTATPAASPTTIQVTLQDPLPSGVTTSGVAVVRQFTGLSPVQFPIPKAAITAAQAATSVVTLDYATLAASPGFNKTSSLADFFDPPAFLPGDTTQIEMGDPNGDGVFGSTLGGALIKPGDPIKSFLFERVLGPMAIGNGSMFTSISAPAASEAQMPIANQQYWDVENDVVALWCWIRGMAPDGSNADGPIDYAHCDVSGMPKLTLQGTEATTFSSVYTGILQPTCAGPCHHTGTLQATTFYMDSLQSTYDRLLGINGSGPSESMTLPFVTQGDRTKSFLFLKVNGDPMAGTRMPLYGTLPQSQIDAIGTWIDQGADND